MLITFVKWIARIIFVIGFVAGSLIASSVNVLAAKIDLEAGVYSELIWTDNVDIAVTKRDADTYMMVNPYIRMNRKGKRIKANLDYQLKATAYAQYSGRNDLQHMLRGDIGVEVVRDILDVDVYISQESEVINADEAISFDGLAYGANTTDKYTAKVSPKGLVPIYGDIGINFFSSHGKVIYDQGIDDVLEHQANLSIGTGIRSTGLNWGINASKQYVQTENENPSEYEQFDVSTSFPLFNRVLLSAKYGEKREVLSSSSNRSWNQGEIWSSTILYALSSKTKLEFGGGNDLYGDNVIVSFHHETKKSKLKLDYSESEVTIFNTDEDDELKDKHKFGFSNDIYVQKKGAVSWKISGVRNTINLYLKREERFYRNLNANEILYAANVQWDLRISGRSDLKANINWWRLGNDFESRGDDITLYSLKYTRDIGQKSSWYAGVDAGIRDGVQAALEYKEFKLRLGAEFRY